MDGDWKGRERRRRAERRKRARRRDLWERERELR